jgi:hypothetical protein
MLFPSSASSRSSSRPARVSASSTTCSSSPTLSA